MLTSSSYKEEAWVRVLSYSIVGRRLQVAVDIYISLFEWIPVIRCEYGNRRMILPSLFYISEKIDGIFGCSISFMMANE
ncbi:Uncharacterised protein [uncultured archaeon]|nr:Uncharacterised protein [uncultured archaeon]